MQLEHVRSYCSWRNGSCCWKLHHINMINYSRNANVPSTWSIVRNVNTQNKNLRLDLSLLLHTMVKASKRSATLTEGGNSWVVFPFRASAMHKFKRKGCWDDWSDKGQYLTWAPVFPHRPYLIIVILGEAGDVGDVQVNFGATSNFSKNIRTSHLIHSIRGISSMCIKYGW